MNKVYLWLAQTLLIACAPGGIHNHGKSLHVKYPELCMCFSQSGTMQI